MNECSTNSPALSPIDSEMAALTQYLSIALDRASILRNKMEAVLSPVRDKPKCEVSKAEPELPLCPLAVSIKGTIYQTIELENIINDLIDRLEA